MKQIIVNRQLNLAAINQKIDSYINEKLNFEIIKTNYTLTVKFPDEKIKYFACVEKTNFGCMALMNKAKAEILKNPLLNKLPTVSMENIKLFHFTESLYDMALRGGEIARIENVTEIDLSEAYNKAFFNHGLISKELYQQISAQRKCDRLKILGSIATNKIITCYENGVMKGKPYFENNPYLRNAWFFICAKVNECMMEAYLRTGENGLFYYVDGIYFRNDENLRSDVLKIMSAHNFETKIKSFEKIALVNSGESIKILIPQNKPGQPKNKVFTVPYRKIKRYIIEN